MAESSGVGKSSSEPLVTPWRKGIPRPLPALFGEQVDLLPTTLEEYLRLRPLRNSREALLYDHPLRPVPTAEEERHLWEREVETGAYLVYSIRRKDGEVVGLISAFSFDQEGRCCESGIVLFPKQNYGRGYAAEAYRLFLDLLRDIPGLADVFVLTSPDNDRAVNLFTRLGFEWRGLERDQGWLIWRMVYRFSDEECC